MADVVIDRVLLFLAGHVSLSLFQHFARFFTIGALRLFLQEGLQRGRGFRKLLHGQERMGAEQGDKRIIRGRETLRPLQLP
jgi:hypothetical protein